MQKEGRSRKEVLEELAGLRMRVAELESSLQGDQDADGGSGDTDRSRLLFLQTLIDTIPSPIFYKDIRGKYLGCNKAFENAMGLSREDLAGKTVYDLAPGELAQKYSEFDEALFKDPGVQCYETSVKYPDGSTHEVIFNKATYCGHDERTTGLVGVFTDITERRRAEDLLRESEGRYRTLFEESPDGIFLSSPDGKITELNPAGLEMLGFASDDELKDISPGRDLYENPQDRERFIARMEEKGVVRDFMVHVRRMDGRRIIIALTATAERDSAGGIKAFRGFIRDVTAHKELEQQLIQAQKMDAVGKLTGGIAHDFNNMIMAMIGYATVLQMKLKKDDPLAENVKNILGVTDRAANLTRRLLAFSRKQIMTLKREDLNTIVEKVEDLLGGLIGEDIEFRTELSGSDLSVMADSGQIEQVLVNLATNARDAMPSGGALTISTGPVDIDEDFIASHGYGELGSYALITVRDTGTGMDADTKSKIFDPFFTTKAVGKGTGLGLSIVYGIIKQHNGYITVSSEPGKGAAFNIYLPAVRTRAGKKELNLTDEPGAVLGRETVLITEDDAEVRRITRTVLEDFGYDVREASDGDEAIQKFLKDRDKIKLVILDVIMPRKNGWEVYDEIQKIKPDIKAIFFSGYNEDMIRRKGTSAETLNFIAKPVWPSEFLKKVREVLNG
ncbi:MAG: PAS domain S-box protein [Deltaproteobacteria bacterium]|nr:PAS domain S-box protein [Deltaproteobacteria bacterium]